MDLKYIPKNEWKQAEIQPASGTVKDKLQILYILLIPAIVIAVASLNAPTNLKIYVQIVDMIFVLLLTLASIILTVRGYLLQKKEEALGYTTWSKPKNKNK